MNSLNARLKFVFFTLITLVFGVMFFWSWFELVVSQKIETDQDLVAKILPSGTLVFTYGLFDQETDSASLFPSLFDFASGESIYIRFGTDNTVLTGIHHSLSPSGEWVSFIDSYPRFTATAAWPTAVYRARISSDSLLDRVYAVATTSVPAAGSSFPAFPSVADDGTLLYMSASETEQADPFSVDDQAEDWDIILVDMNNNERTITEGVHPHWLDSDNFIFLKNDGIYRYSLKDNTETHLLSALSPVTSSHRLMLDSDSEQAILIEPLVAGLRLFDVKRDFDDVILQEKSPIMEAVSSAVFSPDGQQIAMIAVPDSSESAGVSLVVYTIQGEKIYETILPNASVALTSLRLWVH